jgi:hypothetical protein
MSPVSEKLKEIFSKLDIDGVLCLALYLTLLQPIIDILVIGPVRHGSPIRTAIRNDDLSFLYYLRPNTWLT